MIVCLCRRVSDREINHLVRQGARTTSDIASACGAGTACGSCVDDVERFVSRGRVASQSRQGQAGKQALDTDR